MASRPIDIRQMTVEDYDEAAVLWKNTEDVGLDNHVDTREGIASHLARNVELSYVARQEGRIVGAVLCGHDGRRGHLHHLAVARPRHWPSLGRRLISGTWLHRHSKMQHLSVCRQRTWQSVPDAQRLEKRSDLKVLQIQAFQ
jgi:hypothetical protein